MALVVQANLVQLKTFDAKRRGLSSSEHEIRVPPPGAVLRYREALLDRESLKPYSDAELTLRLHEFWGRYCLMQWLFERDGTEKPVNFASVSSAAPLRCPTELVVKLDEVHAMLWRLRFEQRRRTDHTYISSTAFHRHLEWAGQIPLQPLGRQVDQCADEELLLSACQHVGMLATLRWVMDRTREWNDPSLMEVSDQPF